MKNAGKSKLPGKLVRVRRDFERWRRRHRPRGRLPESLWSLATELAREYGLNVTSRTLRLDYNALKKRMTVGISRKTSGANSGPTSVKVKPATPQSEPVLSPLAFVEFLPSGSSVNVECTLECEDGQGARIRIHFKGRELPDLAALSRGLWRTER